MKAELIVDADIRGKKKFFIKEFSDTHFEHPFHFHQFCELTWIRKGYGKIIIGDYIGAFSEGELILHGAGLPHLWKCDEAFHKKGSSARTNSVSIYFTSELIQNLSDDAKVLLAAGNLLSRSQRGIRILGKTREKIAGLILKMTESSGMMQLSYFLLICDLLTHTREYKPLAGIGYRNVNDTSDIKRFQNVYAFVLNNFSKQIMLEEVAGICHLTPPSFSRYFKAKTQKSFSRFLNEIRIGHACKLLQEGGESIQHIGYDCGYNNAVNFYKFFKQITKMTPGEYQKTFNKVNR